MKIRSGFLSLAFHSHSCKSPVFYPSVGLGHSCLIGHLVLPTLSSVTTRTIQMYMCFFFLAQIYCREDCRLNVVYYRLQLSRFGYFEPSVYTEVRRKRGQKRPVVQRNVFPGALVQITRFQDARNDEDDRDNILGFSRIFHRFQRQFGAAWQPITRRKRAKSQTGRPTYRIDLFPELTTCFHSILCIWPSGFAVFIILLVAPSTN